MRGSSAQQQHAACSLFLQRLRPTGRSSECPAPDERLTALDTACRNAVPLSAVVGTPMVVERLGSGLASGSSVARWLRICKISVLMMGTVISCMTALCCSALGRCAEPMVWLIPEYAPTSRPHLWYTSFSSGNPSMSAPLCAATTSALHTVTAARSEGAQQQCRALLPLRRRRRQTAHHRVRLRLQAATGFSLTESVAGRVPIPRCRLRCRPKARRHEPRLQQRMHTRRSSSCLCITRP